MYQYVLHTLKLCTKTFLVTVSKKDKDNCIINNIIKIRQVINSVINGGDYGEANTHKQLQLYSTSNKQCIAHNKMTICILRFMYLIFQLHC